MYDRATRTLWHQFTGEPIVGDLVGTDVDLEFFPTSRTTWGEWKAEHPDTTVVTREGGTYPPWTYTNESDERSIYYAYRANPDSMFPIAHRDQALLPKAEILGVTVKGVDKAYPIEALRKERIVHDRIDDVDLVVVASTTTSDAHIYENPEGLTFSLPQDAPEEGFPLRIVDENGTEWDVSREKLTNASDSSNVLKSVPSNISFWFGWFAFHRDTELYGDDG